MNPLTKKIENEIGALFTATEAAFVNQVVEILRKEIAEEVKENLLVHISSNGKAFKGEGNWEEFKEHLDEFKGFKGDKATDSTL